MNRIFKIRCSSIGKIMGNGKSGNLPVTCQTYLREWYSNDYEPVFSKYFEKGIAVENDLIDFMAEQLGYGIAEKNTEFKEDDYFMGTCDVNINDTIIDVKAPWNLKTLHSYQSIDEDNEWQIRGYIRLWNKQNGIVFYGLMDTPDFVNYDREVTYSDMPDSERWIAYKVTRDMELEQAIIDRVILCREWLASYDELIRSKMGRVL